MIRWGDPGFSALIAFGYLGMLTVLWAALVAGLDRWGRGWRLARPTEPVAGTDLPVVSICVPARDEAGRIGPCVRAALASRWPALDVVVVDDRSSDGTAAEARAAGEGDPRLHVVVGTEPESGWAGKPWACARAAGEARGDLLLFVDADVLLDPDAVPALVRAMDLRGLDLLSAFGTWILEGFWERAVIPAVGWLIRGAVSLDHVNDPGRPEAFANGQLILVRRAAYEAVGGHGAVRDQVLDDVRLAEAFKQRGLRTGLLVAPWAFRVRLYRGLGEIVRGYSKNLYEGMGRNPLVGLGAILFILVGTLFPYVLLAGGIFARLALGWGIPGTPWLIWLTVLVGLQFAFRWRLERFDGRSGKSAWTHPLANLVLVWIVARSVFGVRATWKGRSFVDGRAAPTPPVAPSDSA